MESEWTANLGAVALSGLLHSLKIAITNKIVLMMPHYAKKHVSKIQVGENKNWDERSMELNGRTHMGET